MLMLYPCTEYNTVNMNGEASSTDVSSFPCKYKFRMSAHGLSLSLKPRRSELDCRIFTTFEHLALFISSMAANVDATVDVIATGKIILTLLCRRSQPSRWRLQHIWREQTRLRSTNDDSSPAKGGQISHEQRELRSLLRS